MISNINKTNAYSQDNYTYKTPAADQVIPGAPEDQPAYTVELGAESASGVGYGPVITAMKKEAEGRFQQLRDLVEKLLRRQGVAIDVAESPENIEIPAKVREQAQQEIAPGGYWSPEATAERILKFAKELAGGDPGKLEMLRKATEDGFKAAQTKLGGKLPDISQQTFKLVQEGFDKWSQEANPVKAAS